MFLPSFEGDSHVVILVTFFNVLCSPFVVYRLTEYVTILLTTQNANVVKAKIVHGLRKTIKVQLMILK